MVVCPVAFKPHPATNPKASNANAWSFPEAIEVILLRLGIVI
jgi:hypothetical protein